MQLKVDEFNQRALTLDNRVKDEIIEDEGSFRKSKAKENEVINMTTGDETTFNSHSHNPSDMMNSLIKSSVTK